MTEKQDKLIADFWRFTEHLEFLYSDKWLEKFWEYRNSLINIREWRLKEIEKKIWQ